MKQITKRLTPGQDLREEIEKLVKENQVKAGVVLSVVGGIKEGYFRMPDGKTVRHLGKPLEIVSGTGTISQDNCHIHISASDEEGSVVGGHLKPGCTVKETAEVVLLVFDDVVYKREPDENTGYDELVIK
jgi:predicted DNA-binding protein with PD1-like motif